MNVNLPIEALKSFGLTSGSNGTLQVVESMKNIYFKYQNEIKSELDVISRAVLNQKITNLSESDIVELVFYYICGEEDDKTPILYRVFNYYLSVLSANFLKTCSSAMANYMLKHEDELFISVCGKVAAKTFLPNWLSTKQIYSIDKEFMNALAFTENLEISKDMIEHLPYDHFYLDLSEGGYFYKGAFIDLFKSDKEVKVAITLCAYQNKKPILIGCEWRFKYKEELLDLNFKINDSEITSYYKNLYTKKIDKINNKEYVLSDEQEMDRKIINSICFQTICYLVSQEPDIYPAPLTHGSSKKGKKYIKSSLYNDINIDEVGVRFGNAFRKECERREMSEKDEQLIDGPTRKITPHLRRAHWSHYWVGKGRKQCVVRWIQPTFVVGIPKDAVIHKVS